MAYTPYVVKTGVPPPPTVALVFTVQFGVNLIHGIVHRVELLFLSIVFAGEVDIFTNEQGRHKQIG